MKTITAILFTAIFFAGCEKEDNTPPQQPEPCETQHTGKLCFTNKIAAPLELRLDGNFKFTVDPDETQCLEQQPVGSFYYWATDNIGYYSGNVIVLQCNTVEIVLQ